MASVNLDKSIKNTSSELDCNYVCRSQNAFKNFSGKQQIFTVVGFIALVAIILVVLSYCFFPQLQRLLGRPNRQRPEYLEGQDPEELGEGSSWQVRFREPEVTATYTEARGESEIVSGHTFQLPRHTGPRARGLRPVVNNYRGLR